MPSATISGSKTSDIGNPHDGKSIHLERLHPHRGRRVQFRTHVILMPQPRKILLSRYTIGTAAIIVGHQQRTNQGSWANGAEWPTWCESAGIIGHPLRCHCARLEQRD